MLEWHQQAPACVVFSVSAFSERASLRHKTHPKSDGRSALVLQVVNSNKGQYATQKKSSHSIKVQQRVLKECHCSCLRLAQALSSLPVTSPFSFATNSRPSSPRSCQLSVFHDVFIQILSLCWCVRSNSHRPRCDGRAPRHTRRRRSPGDPPENLLDFHCIRTCPSSTVHMLR